MSDLKRPNEESKILVTGATGYIGGRLVPRLLEKGYSVRVLVRDSQRLQGRSWLNDVEVFQGDVLDSASLTPAMEGIDKAYYLIHSMTHNRDFHERDVLGAKNFAQAAEAARINQIIYLGGLGEGNGDLSKHLLSRQVTGDYLRQGVVPVTEFRAAVIVGSGSISFEMIRYLTERVPIMVAPRWVSTKIQPIAIRDVLDYLIAGLETSAAIGKIIEIGGQEIMTYKSMMLEYAKIRGLKRFLIPVPLLTPLLSSYWIHWVTPIHASIARPLIEGLRVEVISTNDLANRIFPNIKPMKYVSAVQRALSKLDAGDVESMWSDSLFSSQEDSKPVTLTTENGMIIEHRNLEIEANSSSVFQVFTQIGGKNGYGYMDWAWVLRGILDRLVGGVGFRRGRRAKDHVRVGDAVDFWRVEAVETNSLMRLRAEMKVPGKAWLQFKIHPLPNGYTSLNQTAFFAPKGLLGLLYWYLLYPLHSPIFSGMIKYLARQAKNGTRINNR